MQVNTIPREALAARDIAGWNRHRNNVLLIPGESVSERIDRLLRKRGMSYRALARETGLSHRTVLGSPKLPGVTAFTLWRIACALGVSLDYLYAGKEKS